MIRTRHQQATVWGDVWAEEVHDLWEPWMRKADQLLDDDELVTKVFEAQGKPWKKSRTRGRLQTRAEVCCGAGAQTRSRLELSTLAREVRANLVYRNFTRIGTEKVPDAKTMGRLGQVVTGETVAKLHRRVVEIAAEKRVVRAARCGWTLQW